MKIPLLNGQSSVIDIDVSWIVHVREVNQQINFVGDK